MRWCVSLSFLLALWGGCGGQEPTTVSEPLSGAATGEPAARPGTTAPSVGEKNNELDFLRGQIGAYSQRVDTEKDKQEAMLARHRKEIAALGDLSVYHREERELIRRIRRSENQIKHYEKKAGPADPGVNEVIEKLDALRAEDEKLTEQLEDLRGAFSRRMRMPELAETPVARDLKTIRAARDRWLADTTDVRAKGAARTRSAANKSFRGWLAETPVARNLKTIRAVRDRWLADTTEARARGAPRVRAAVNKSFRAWIGEDENRGRVAALALEKSRKKPKLARYDFTKTEFFLFCQLLEDELDRKNVAVEADLLGEQRKKEAVLVDRMVALREKISVIENSPEARKATDAEETLATVMVYKQKFDLAQNRLEQVRNHLQAKRDLEKKHQSELKASQTAFDEVKRLLADAKHKFDDAAKR